MACVAQQGKKLFFFSSFQFQEENPKQKLTKRKTISRLYNQNTKQKNCNGKSYVTGLFLYIFFFFCPSCFKNEKFLHFTLGLSIYILYTSCRVVCGFFIFRGTLLLLNVPPHICNNTQPLHVSRFCVFSFLLWQISRTHWNLSCFMPFFFSFISLAFTAAEPAVMVKKQNKHDIQWESLL